MRMKRIIALYISVVLLITGCSQKSDAIVRESQQQSETGDSAENSGEQLDQKMDLEVDSEIENIAHESESINRNGENAEFEQISEQTKTEIPEDVEKIQEEFYFAKEEPNYDMLSDAALLPYLEDSIYENLVAGLNNDDYFVENVEAIYISKEYLDEFAYNSRSNIYFGYSLEDLEKQFQGKKYVFTLGDNGETTVIPFEGYVDPYEKVIKDVAVGSGVILVCVTVSAVSAGVGAPAISMIFAASARTGAAMALSSGAIGSLAAGVVTGIKTNDFEKALTDAAVSGGEGFKCGAIMGSLSGGAIEAIALKGATLNGLTMNQAAAIQKESGYPLDVIKEFSSMEQYQICKDSGLMAEMVDGKLALVRRVDLFDYVDEMGRTNAQRIQAGLSPVDPTGVPYELHHIGQKTDSTLAILTRAEHRLGDNNKIWHEVVEAGEGVHSQISDAVWANQRQQFWNKYLELATKGGGI